MLLLLLLLRLETATGWRNVLLDGVLIAQVLMPGPASPKPRPRYKLCSFSHNYPSTVNSRAESSQPNCEPCLRPRARFRFGTGSIFFLKSRVAYWFRFVDLLGPALSSLLRALLQHSLSVRVFKKF